MSKENLLDFCNENKDFFYLLEEFDTEMNESVELKDVYINSSKEYYWVCRKCNNSYKTRIVHRINGHNCPYCCTPTRKLLKGFNDLETKNPEVLIYWDYDKNKIFPNEVMPGSARKVWWKCKEGHSYLQEIRRRVRDAKCPYCSSQALLSGFNDFETRYPELLSEWDYEKNEKRPDEVMPGSHYKAWWICPFGHSYQTYIYNRVGNKHIGCSICSKENHTSFPEQAIYFYIKQVFSKAINSDYSAIGKELDIYIPEYKIGIEYDGYNWHKENDKENQKNISCIENDIFLIRIRESGLKLYDNCCCIIREDLKSDNGLTKVIIEVIEEIKKKINYSFDIDINVERDIAKIYKNYINQRKENSLKVVFPTIASEWDYEKNENLLPEMFSPKSEKKVWWKCSLSHQYLMSIQNRTTQNCGCYYCSSKKILKGFNDLETWCKKNSRYDILNSWNYELNTLKPNEVFPQSVKKVWWKCLNCNDNYESRIDHRINAKYGCPLCARKEIDKARKKCIICVETGEIFKGLKEAEEKMNINKSCISNVCKGKQKTAGGYHWEYYDKRKE